MFDLVLENGNLITMNDNNDKSYTYPLSNRCNILCNGLFHQLELFVTPLFNWYV